MMLLLRLYPSDIIVLTQETTTWVIFLCMKTLKAGNLIIER